MNEGKPRYLLSVDSRTSDIRERRGHDETDISRCKFPAQMPEGLRMQLDTGGDSNSIRATIFDCPQY
ncbi:hypothetical protein GCM10009589_16810 [Arthrobacter pascens]